MADRLRDKAAAVWRGFAGPLARAPGDAPPLQALVALTLAAHGVDDESLPKAWASDPGLLLPHELAALEALPPSTHAASAAAAGPLAELMGRERDPATALLVAAVRRRLADHLAVSPATLTRIAELHAEGISPDFLLAKADPQAIGFMVDILGTLRSLLVPRYSGQRLSVLDLGAKSAAGSDLLARLGQQGGFAKVKLDVTCADIDPTYRGYSTARHPLVEYLAADAFETGRRWDIVVCSHVIEHVSDPMAFVQRVRSLAARFVVLAFPFQEDPAALIPGHLHSLGHEFLRNLRPMHHEVYDGLFWTQSLCCIAVLEANATSP